MVSYRLAPMEGITDYRFRQVQAALFGPADRYYTPFIAPTECHRFTERDMKELLPEHNEGLAVVPQLLGKNAEDILWAIREIRELGYQEVNLNFGCPSGTVVKKGKGAGILADLDHLEEFLNRVFDSAVLPVSVKSRTGVEDSKHFPEIMELYNQFPLKEVILHPRFQKQQYSGFPDMSSWDRAVNRASIPLCYNGNLFRAEDCRAFEKNYPDIPEMIGRGMVANPGMIRELKEGRAATEKEFMQFHEELYRSAQRDIHYERAVLLHLKEFWYYFSCSFEDCAKGLKRIQKANDYASYESAAASFFREYRLKEKAGFFVR